MERRRKRSPQRRVHPPPWGAAGLLTWTGWLSCRTEKKLGGLCPQVEEGASSHCVFAQHVSASLQKVDAGTEAGVWLWTESLKAGGQSALPLVWYWLQTKSNHVEQRWWELWFNFLYIYIEAVDHLQNDTGGFAHQLHTSFSCCQSFSKHTSLMPARKSTRRVTPFTVNIPSSLCFAKVM